MPTAHYLRIQKLADKHPDLYHKWKTQGGKGYPPLYFWEEHNIIKSEGPHHAVGTTKRKYTKKYKEATMKAKGHRHATHHPVHPHAIHHLGLTANEYKRLKNYYSTHRKLEHEAMKLKSSHIPLPTGRPHLPPLHKMIGSAPGIPHPSAFEKPHKKKAKSYLDRGKTAPKKRRNAYAKMTKAQSDTYPLTV